MNDRKTPDSNDLDESILDKQNALKVVFCWAAADGDTEMLKELFKAGADPEKCCYGALMNAAENGHAETVKYLLEESNFEVLNVKDAFRRAAAKEHFEVIRVILDWLDSKKSSDPVHKQSTP